MLGKHGLDLGVIAKAYRAKNKMYQSELALKLKCTNSALSRIESGEHKPYGELALDILELVEPGIKQRIELHQIEAEQIIKRNVNWLEKFYKKTKVSSR